MNDEIINLCMQNIFETLQRLYTSSDLTQQFLKASERFTKKNDNESYKFIISCADLLVNGKKADIVGPEDSLQSVFNLLSNNGRSMRYIDLLPNEIKFPTENVTKNSNEQKLLLERFICSLSSLPNNSSKLNHVLTACDEYLSYIPSGRNHINGYLSMAESIKFSTCLCACTEEYFIENKIICANQKIIDKFLHNNSLLLFSCDISGIQKFIYTVSGKGVLKSLRSRSLYLDILLQHILNCLLNELELPISNIVYSGGGRGYLLLPSTDKTRQVIQTTMRNVNHWLLINFDISLYLAYGYTECSPNDLFSCNDVSAYSQIYVRLSTALSESKMNRYHAEEIKMLNCQRDIQHDRECRICSRNDRKLDSDDVCSFCRDFIAVSPFLLNESLSIAILKAKQKNDRPCLRLPSIYGSTDYLYFLNSQQIAGLKEGEAVEIYHFNNQELGLKIETGLYAYTIDGELATFEQLAELSQGIKRIAVLRADVDNLGYAFTKGFESAQAIDCRPFLLTAALSEQLSFFFKRYLKSIVSGAVGEINAFSLTKNQSAQKKLVVVYSGGDDMFLVGAWNDVIEAAVDLRRSFEKYTAGALSFSAGIGIFEAKYPLYAMAEETEGLVEFAKSLDDSKDAVALFGSAIRQDQAGDYHLVAPHCYHWNDFVSKVVGDKLRVLKDYFERSEGLESANGNAFLYRLKSYIEELLKNPDEKINIARFAYLLARLAPTTKAQELQDAYSDFSAKMYRWILNPDDRHELLTAITIYVYSERKE